MRHTTQRLALLAVLVLGGACVRPAVSPPTPSLGQLIQGYERETSPYYPFTASERGLHQYDRVLANDIGDDWIARAEGDLYPISWRAPSRRRRRAVRQGPRDLRRLRVSPRPVCRELRLPVDAGAGQPGGLQLADPLSDPRRRPRYPPVQDGPELRGLSRTRRRLRRVDGHRDRQHASGPGARHHAAARSRAPGASPARRPDRRQSRDQPLLGADQALSVVVRRRRPPDAGGEVSPRDPGPDRAGVSPDAGLHAERVSAALPHHGRLRRSP